MSPISGWGVSDPLSSLPSLHLIQPCYRAEVGVPCPSQVWLWCYWPDGGPGAQTRKPPCALRAKDSERVNIYYLPNRNEAQLGLPSQGSQMSMEGRKRSGGSGVRGFCHTWYLAWGHAAGLLPASSWVSLDLGVPLGSSPSP